MKLKNFIKFKIKEMNKEARAMLYSVVKEFLGEKVVVVKSATEDGQPTQTRIFHKVVDGDHWYIIPLSESPTEEQVDKIAERLVKSLNMGNFEIESSLVQSQDIFDNSIAEDDFSAIADKFAQKLHEDWLNERIEKGWRYGEQRNDADKTHPLVKSWNQLSENEKSINPKLVKEFVDILKSNGFKIIKK